MQVGRASPYDNWTPRTRSHSSLTYWLKYPVQKQTLYSSVKKNYRGWTIEILSWRRSDGPKRQIAVEASIGGTSYTFRLQEGSLS
jgi:hypothetical protein